GPFDEVVGAAPLEPVAPPVDEQRCFRPELHPREPLAARLHVRVDDPFEGFFDGDGPFFAAFAEDLEAPFAGPAVDRPVFGARSSESRRPASSEVARKARSRSGHGNRTTRGPLRWPEGPVRGRRRPGGPL